MDFTQSIVKHSDLTILMRFQVNSTASQPIHLLLAKETYGLFGNGTRDYPRLSLSLYHLVNQVDYGQSLSIGKRKFLWTCNVTTVNVQIVWEVDLPI